MAVGLVVGKTIGLTAGVALAVALGLSRLPAGVRWAHVVGVAALAGIGFTVSLFIADLAYTDPADLDAAKIGVLGGSVVAAIVGLLALLLVSRRSRAPGTGRRGWCRVREDCRISASGCRSKCSPARARARRSER